MSIHDLLEPFFRIAETKQFERIEKTFILTFLMFSSSGVLVLLMTGGASQGDGSRDVDMGILKVF